MNPEKTYDSFIRVGETSYTWGEKGVDALGEGGTFVIYTAGPAVYDAASDLAGDASDVAKTFAGDAVNFFDDAGDEAEQAFVIFVFVQSQLLDEIFDELSNMAEALANGTFGDYVSGTLSAGGEAFLTGASAVYNFIFG